MPRSSRRRRLTALLLLLWQGAVLAPGAVDAHAAQQLPAGESQSVAKATMPAAKGIPAEVVQWFDAMKEAADKGEGAEALQMHQKVMAWVQANLPEMHVFRARVMVRYGYVLSKLEKHQDALISAKGGADMLREIAKSSPDPDTRFFLTVALLNLGRRHAKLEQMQAAVEVFQEALSILRQHLGPKADNAELQLLKDALAELSVAFAQLGKTQDLVAEQQATLLSLRVAGKTKPIFQDAVTDMQVSLGETFSKLGRFSEAQSAFQEALEGLRIQAKARGDRRAILKSTLYQLGEVNAKLGQLESLKSIWKEVLPILEDELLEARRLPGSDLSSRQSLALVLLQLAIGYGVFLDQPVQSLLAAQEALPICRESAKVDPVDKTWQSCQIQAMKIIFTSYLNSRHQQKALAVFDELLPLLREMAKTNPSERETLISMLVSIGQLYSIDLISRDFQLYYQEALDLINAKLPDLRQQAESNPPAAGKLANTLQQLGEIRSGLGNAQQALEPALEATHIFRRLAKRDMANTEKLAGALESLAEHYRRNDQLERALQVNQEAVQTLQELVMINPSKRLVLAKALLNLSKRYTQADKLQQALATAEEAVFILREVAKTSPDARNLLASSLGHNLYNSYRDLGLHRQAMQAAEESVQLFRVLQANESVVDAMFPLAIVNVGLGHARQGQWHQSLLAFKEAVNQSRQQQDVIFGGHFFHGITLSYLALPYNALGQRQEAMAISRQAVKVLAGQAPNNSDMKMVYAGLLQQLAGSYADLGLFNDALLPMLEAVRMSNTLGKTSGETIHRAQSLVALAYLYGKLGRDQEALSTSAEAISIFQTLSKIPGTRKASVASAMVLKGMAHHNLGQSRFALSSTKDAIQLLREANADEVFTQFELANALTNLGRFMADEGQSQQAQAPAQEAVVILRRLAQQAPGWLDRLAESSYSLATIAQRQGQSSLAIDLMQEAISSEVRFLQQQLPLMPDARRQALVDTLERRWERPFSLAQQGEAGASLAMFTRLNRHSPLQDIERRQGILSRSSSATQALVSQLSLLNTQLSNPSLSSQGRQNVFAESEQLQEELHRQLPAIQPRLVEIAEVARQLPADGVLVEFQRFSPYNVAKPEKDAWEKPRYLALVLDRRARVLAVDLGDADALEQAIDSALDRTRYQQPGAQGAWAVVSEKLFSPLRGALVGKRQLLVSPDGQLHRVPFSALALLAGNSAALPTSLSLQTIGSGRDLVPLGGPTLTSPLPPASAALVLADPQTIGWDPLVRAASEGLSVASALGTMPHLGQTATVKLLERSRGPRIIHVAGHGYFDPQATGDPLLASGLALAGADKTRQPSRQSNPQPSAPSSAHNPQPLTPSPVPSALPSDDGYLTAKEAARLQLDGTQLVVLSACESGLGSERSGEGLFGLRRALTVAGARGTLLSLWKVPEHATETFMTRFYAQLGQGIPPAEAVRRVQAEFRAQPRIDGWSDPFYWAGWQYSGLPDPAR